MARRLTRPLFLALGLIFGLTLTGHAALAEQPYVHFLEYDHAVRDKVASLMRTSGLDELAHAAQPRWLKMKDVTLVTGAKEKVEALAASIPRDSLFRSEPVSRLVVRGVRRSSTEYHHYRGRVELGPGTNEPDAPLAQMIDVIRKLVADPTGMNYYAWPVGKITAWEFTIALPFEEKPFYCVRKGNPYSNW